MHAFLAIWNVRWLLKDIFYATWASVKRTMRRKRSPTRALCTIAQGDLVKRSVSVRPDQIQLFEGLKKVQPTLSTLSVSTGSKQQANLSGPHRVVTWCSTLWNPHCGLSPHQPSQYRGKCRHYKLITAWNNFAFEKCRIMYFMCKDCVLKYMRNTLKMN